MTKETLDSAVRNQQLYIDAFGQAERANTEDSVFFTSLLSSDNVDEPSERLYSIPHGSMYSVRGLSQSLHSLQQGVACTVSSHVNEVSTAPLPVVGDMKNVSQAHRTADLIKDRTADLIKDRPADIIKQRYSRRMFLAPEKDSDAYDLSMASASSDVPKYDTKYTTPCIRYQHSALLHKEPMAPLDQHETEANTTLDREQVFTRYADIEKKSKSQTENSTIHAIVRKPNQEYLQKNKSSFI